MSGIQDGDNLAELNISKKDILRCGLCNSRHEFDYNRPKLPNLLDILEGDGGKIK